eukprot:TRINITY_DN58131_c0_g1_i1.p1 TRINITY_DN58131_c0_g1~~TRINITY_DN58131_c0_g1_i1.p1  ORF type:complete len:171 (+),score=23.18 TRINITY_DN58131_c0_g1_i1:86-598(+)
MLDEDDEHDILGSLGPPGGICVPAIAITGGGFAAGFGAIGATINGSRSWLQFIAQVVGGSLGAFSAATMHKTKEQTNLRRFVIVFFGAVVGTSVAFVTLPVMDMSIFAEATLTAVSSTAVAVLTDPDIPKTFSAIIELCLPAVEGDSNVWMYQRPSCDVGIADKELRIMV